MALTPEDQWAQINYPSFMGGALGKVKQVKDSMAAEQAFADQVTTYLNDVPIVFSNPEVSDEWIDINIGLEHDGKPQVSLHIPLCWVEG